MAACNQQVETTPTLLTLEGLDSHIEDLRGTEQRHMRLFVHALIFNRPQEWMVEKSSGWFSVSGGRIGPFVLQKEHKMCRTSLERSGLVEIKRNAKGEVSYKLGKSGIEYRLLAPITRGESSDGQLTSKLQNAPHQLQEYYREYISKHRRGLFDVLTSPKLTFDKAEAVRLVTARHSGDHSQTVLALHRIESLFQPEWRKMTECKYGRMHSAVTGIEKEVRCLLRWNERPLYEVDVKCSQPMLVQCLGEVDKLWMDLLASGDLYEYLAEQLGLQIDDPDARQIAKYHSPDKKEERIDGQCLGVIPWMYSPISQGHTHRQRIADVIRSRFPKVYRLITSIKQEGKSYKVFSHELQKRESEVVIDEVACGLLKDNPNSCVVTIHDSILCDSREMADETQRRFETEFGRLGIVGRVEVQSLRKVLEEIEKAQKKNQRE